MFHFGVKSQEIELGKYREAEEKLEDIAGRRGMSPIVKDIPHNLRILKESDIQRKTELSVLEAKLVYQRDTLARFNANSLHTAPEFGELLKSKDIAYITGENYLKALDSNKQKEVLLLNPMLPFCFLVGKSDFEKATTLYTDGIDRICPVIILEEAEEDLKAGEHAVSLTDFGRAMCYYFEESFDPNTKDTFKDKLEYAVAQTEKSRAEWLDELGVIR